MKIRLSYPHSTVNHLVFIKLYRPASPWNSSSGCFMPGTSMDLWKTNSLFVPGSLISVNPSPFSPRYKEEKLFRFNTLNRGKWYTLMLLALRLPERSVCGHTSRLGNVNPTTTCGPVRRKSKCWKQITSSTKRSIFYGPILAESKDVWVFLKKKRKGTLAPECPVSVRQESVALAFSHAF